MPNTNEYIREFREGNPGMRILILSDLHFPPNGDQLESIDDKANIQGLGRPFLADNQTERFFAHLKYLYSQPKGSSSRVVRPTALLVLGDLIEKGNLDKINGEGAFDHATQFIAKVAEKMEIESQNIFVIPGNHDVDLSGFAEKDEFHAYREAVRKFQSPTIGNNDVEPLFRKIDGNSPESAIELLLFVSPTVRGSSQKEDEQIKKRMVGFRLVSEDGTSITGEKAKKKKYLNLAAIGTQQRKAIRPSDLDPLPIRIAALHHHIVPHSQIEISSFESVVDGGKVLEELMRHRYDLVLTGHKHSEKLSTRRDADGSSIDIYTAPSLFKSGPKSLAGFTILDIHSNDAPCYATMWRFTTVQSNDIHRYDLEREGRVDKNLANLLREHKPSVQNKTIYPVLDGLGKGIKWGGGEYAKDLFANSIERIKKQAQDLANEKIHLEAPMDQQWSTLISIAEKRGDGGLRFASDSDLDYWYRAVIAPDDSPIMDYLMPINEFNGKPKERILVLKRTREMTNEEKQKLRNVILRMREWGFAVHIADEQRVPRKPRPDFGILGKIAIGEFDHFFAGHRSLTLSFGREDLDRIEKVWDNLKKKAYWSSDRDTPLDKFLPPNKEAQENLNTKYGEPHKPFPESDLLP